MIKEFIFKWFRHYPTCCNDLQATEHRGENNNRRGCAFKFNVIAFIIRKPERISVIEWPITSNQWCLRCRKWEDTEIWNCGTLTTWNVLWIFFSLFLCIFFCADQQQVKYETLGCFKDSQVDPRPLPELLADLTSEVDWYDPNKVIKKCAKLASDKGYTAFGLQSYGQCWSGKKAAKTYDSDGVSSGCGVGLGGREENMVFKIILDG